MERSKMEKYKTALDLFYSFGPFRLIDVVQKKQGQEECQCCGNRRLKCLCVVVNKQGDSWNIGRECWKNIEERQYSDPACSFTELCIKSEDRAR
jgi:hypothetical protein